MKQEFFEIETEYARTSFGLILPHKTGRAVVALGAIVPAVELESLERQLETTFEPGQGAIYLSPDFFTLSALNVAREHGWTPPQA